MKTREHILKLIEAQDLVRRAWAEFDKTILGPSLREVDRELTKIINQIGKMYQEIGNDVQEGQ